MGWGGILAKKKMGMDDKKFKNLKQDWSGEIR